MNQETIIKLVELQMQQFNSTRDTKTKINIALWTFLAVTAGFAATHTPPRPEGDALLSIGFLFLLALVPLHIAWMIGIQKSLDFDKACWVRYREMLDPSQKGKTDNLSVPKGPAYWVFIESGTTIVLVLLALLVAHG